MDEARTKVYEELMSAQEQIAQVRYARGVSHESVVAAMDAAEAKSCRGGSA